MLQPTSQTHQHQRHCVDSHQIKAWPTPLGIHPFPTHIMLLSHLAGCGVGVGWDHCSAWQPLPTFPLCWRHPNAALAPGHVYRGNFTCCLLLCRQQLLMLPWVPRHRHIWLLSQALWAINATCCRQGIVGSFSAPIGDLLDSSILPMDLWESSMKHLKSSLGPFFNLRVGKFQQPQSLACLVSPSSPRIR